MEDLVRGRPEWALSFERGDVLTRAGAAAEALYVIRRGRVSVIAAGGPARIEGAGSGVGVAAALRAGVYASEVLALETGAALRVPREGLGDMAAASPGLLLALARELAQAAGAGEAAAASAEAPIDQEALAPAKGKADAGQEGELSALYARRSGVPSARRASRRRGSGPGR